MSRQIDVPSKIYAEYKKSVEYVESWNGRILLAEKLSTGIENADNEMKVLLTGSTINGTSMFSSDLDFVVSSTRQIGMKQLISDFNKLLFTDQMNTFLKSHEIKFISIVSDRVRQMQNKVCRAEYEITFDGKKNKFFVEFAFYGGTIVGRKLAILNKDDSFRFVCVFIKRALVKLGLFGTVKSALTGVSIAVLVASFLARQYSNARALIKRADEIDEFTPPLKSVVKFNHQYVGYLLGFLEFVIGWNRKDYAVDMCEQNGKVFVRREPTDSMDFIVIRSFGGKNVAELIGEASWTQTVEIFSKLAQILKTNDLNRLEVFCQ